MATNSQPFPVILSTKVLSESHRTLLRQSGLDLVEYDAIDISPVAFDAPAKVQNAIITSQNAAQSLLTKNILPEKVFCVGEKTQALLLRNGQNVIKMMQNASELAHFIAKNYKNDVFFHFCGNLRRPDLSEILTQNKVALTEIIAYQTTLIIKKFDRHFDGVLFFSPSGVTSYVAQNSLQNTVAFCIGNTTASEAKKHTNSVAVANATTVESVINKAAKLLIPSYEKRSLS